MSKTQNCAKNQTNNNSINNKDSISNNKRATSKAKKVTEISDEKRKAEARAYAMSMSTTASRCAPSASKQLYLARRAQQLGPANYNFWGSRSNTNNCLPYTQISTTTGYRHHQHQHRHNRKGKSFCTASSSSTSSTLSLKSKPQQVQQKKVSFNQFLVSGANASSSCVQTTGTTVLPLSQVRMKQQHRKQNWNAQQQKQQQWTLENRQVEQVQENRTKRKPLQLLEMDDQQEEHKALTASAIAAQVDDILSTSIPFQSAMNKRKRQMREPDGSCFLVPKPQAKTANRICVSGSTRKVEMPSSHEDRISMTVTVGREWTAPMEGRKETIKSRNILPEIASSNGNGALITKNMTEPARTTKLEDLSMNAGFSSIDIRPDETTSTQTRIRKVAEEETIYEPQCVVSNIGIINDTEIVSKVTRK